MKWDFTVEDVGSGKAVYTVAEFKKDLLEEIKVNIAKDCGEEQTLQFFSSLTLMLCTSLAFGKSIDDFVKSTKKHSPVQTSGTFWLRTRHFLRISGSITRKISRCCSL
jgi:hypothetical protein